MFQNRTDARRQLAELLDDHDVKADEVVALETPPHFGAVGQFYESFEQVSDEEAMAYLED